MNHNIEKSDNDRKKEFLNSYQEEKKSVRRLEQQLEELQINKLSPSCMIGDGMPHAHNRTDLSDYAARVDELEREIWAARYSRIDAFQKVQEAIEKMENEREKLLLTYRYLRGYGWERIAVEMGVTWRHTLRLHGTALKNFKVS